MENCEARVLRLTSTSSDSHWDTQIYNSVLASYLIRNIVLNIWGIFSPHEKMMVINLPPRSGYQGPFPVLGTPQNYTWWFNWRIPNYGLIIDWSPSQWTELQEFPVWIRFLSSQQKCRNCLSIARISARCSFLIFLNFLLSGRCQWSSLASVLEAGVPTVIGIFRRQLPCSRAEPTCSDARRKHGAALLQKQFETIQNSCVFGADEICFDGCVSQ